MTLKRRPWYVYGPLADDYARIARSGGDLQVLKTLKIARSIIVNLGIISITLYALFATSADVTAIAITGLITLGLYNGVEVADYAALATAFAEINSGRDDDGGR